MYLHPRVLRQIWESNVRSEQRNQGVWEEVESGFLRAEVTFSIRFNPKHTTAVEREPADRASKPHTDSLHAHG